MIDFLCNEPQNVVVVGDAFVAVETMLDAVQKSCIRVGKISSAFWGSEDTDEFAARQLNLERHGAEAEAYADGLDELISDCTVLLTHFNPVPRALIEKAPDLKVILTCRGGLEHIDVEAASERGIPVINVIRNAIPVAEFALGMMLDLTRNISASHYQMRQGKWVKEFPNSAFCATLSSLTVGLAGMGNIGIELAIRLKAMGVHIIAQDDYLDRDRLARNGLDDVVIVPTLEDLFRQADLVSIHLRLTPETEHMIDKRYFSLMKPTAYFINCARGGLVNQADLLEVLRTHAIAGAALDVFDSEPLTADDGFAELDNVLLTSHIAGATVDAIPRAPFLLMREVDKIVKRGLTERIVNRGKITLEA